MTRNSKSLVVVVLLAALPAIATADRPPDDERTPATVADGPTPTPEVTPPEAMPPAVPDETAPRDADPAPAQTDVASEEYMMAPAPTAPDDDRTIVQRWGLALSVGGGVIGFVDEAARDTLTTGGAWEARVAAGTRLPLSIEAAYVGSAQPIDALGVDDNAMLLGTGLEANARLNFLTGDVQPYILAGAGWTRYDLTNTDVNTSDVADQDDVFQVPLGVGIGYRYEHLLLDARAVFRPAADADLLVIDPAADDSARLDTWSVALRGGFEL